MRPTTASNYVLIASTRAVQRVADYFQVRIVHHVADIVIVVHRVRLKRLVELDALVLVCVRHCHRLVALFRDLGAVEVLGDRRLKIRVLPMRILQAHWLLGET